MPRWTSSLPPGSSMASTTAVLAGWQMAVLLPCGSPASQLRVPGAWCPELRIPRPSELHVWRPLLPFMLEPGHQLPMHQPLPQGLYLFVILFSLVAWANFHNSQIVFSKITIFVNPPVTKFSLCSGGHPKAPPTRNPPAHLLWDRCSWAHLSHLSSFSAFIFRFVCFL